MRAYLLIPILTALVACQVAAAEAKTLRMAYDSDPT
jgi:hypothetical protein